MKEQGCQDCRICRDVEDEEILFFSVRWEARSNLEHYMRSESAGVLLGAVDLLGETVKVGFDQVSPNEGIDTLKRMRKRR